MVLFGSGLPCHPASIQQTHMVTYCVQVVMLYAGMWYHLLTFTKHLPTHDLNLVILRKNFESEIQKWGWIYTLICAILGKSFHLSLNSFFYKMIIIEVPTSENCWEESMRQYNSLAHSTRSIKSSHYFIIHFCPLIHTIVLIFITLLHWSSLGTYYVLGAEDP